MINALQNSFFAASPLALGASPSMAGFAPAGNVAAPGVMDSTSFSWQAMREGALPQVASPAGSAGMLGEMMETSLLMTMMMELVALFQAITGSQKEGRNDGLLSGLRSLFSPSASSSAGDATGAFGAGGSSATAVDASNLQGTTFGKTLAQDALSHANNEKGLCLKNVGEVLRRHGIECGPAPSAYMVADQMAGNKEFKEVQVSRDQLKNLPAGSVIVWDRYSGNPHGHISISLGDGREFSGPIRNQTTLPSSYRVFIPR